MAMGCMGFGSRHYSRRESKGFSAIRSFSLFLFDAGSSFGFSDFPRSKRGGRMSVASQDMEYAADWHDTGFLNADDEDFAEDEECMPSAEQTSLLDNSGWSSRCRAVAKYLQLLFEKEAKHGRKVVPMDNLLVGKTRKEASRMFFEALVLKTRDYVHVEQQAPFGDINIKPRVMLMKSDL